jgi:hypothetical protein
MFYVWAFCHTTYQYDSLILSKRTWAYPRQHLQQLLWCQGRWLADVTKECLETNFHHSSTLLRKLCVHYANGVDNVESVYFFYSNPVLYNNNQVVIRVSCAVWTAEVIFRQQLATFT